MALLDKLYLRLLGKAQAAEDAVRAPVIPVIPAVSKPERGKPYALAVNRNLRVQVLIQHQPDFRAHENPLSRAYTVIIVLRDTGEVLAQAATEKAALTKAKRILRPFKTQRKFS